MLSKLLADHDQLRQKGAVLRAFLNQPEFPCPYELAHARWDVCSAVLQHLAYEDRHLYSKLLSDPRPHVVQIGRKFQVSLEGIHQVFAAHATYWTARQVALDWDGFREAAKLQGDGMLRRIADEEAELFPLIERAEIDMTRSVYPVSNWARRAFEIKDAIFDGIETQQRAKG
ncbi:MAG: hemerythrin domain-containing protein [Blastomonas sp.]